MSVSGPVKRALDRLEEVKQRSGYHVAKCPAHDDRNPSLSVREGDDGRVLLKCYAGCDVQEIVGALGLGMSDLFEDRNGHGTRRQKQIEETYDYRDADGKLLFQAVRYTPKGFSQRRPDGCSGWTWNLNGVERVLYRLPDLLEADPKETLFLVEGEKDANRLASLGLTATTNPQGAKKWREEYTAILKGRRVALLPDNDDEGRKHAEMVAATLSGEAESVKMVTLPNLPPKGDVSDWLKAGGTAEQLSRIVEQTQEWQASAPTLDEPECNGLGTITAADLMAMKLPPPTWIVPGMLPEGVTLLAGKPKLGKSWMALGLGVAVATGGVALGTKRVEQGSCLYLALEDNVRRLQKRLGKLLNGGEAPENLHFHTDWQRLDDGGVEQLGDWLKAHPDARLVVIDTLAKVRPRQPGKNVYAEDYAALERLLPLASEHSVAIVVVHHLRKSGALDPLDEISGSTGLTGGVDGVLILKRGPGNADAFLYVEGRDIEDPAELALSWDRNLASWTIAGDAEQYQISQERQTILRVMKEADKPLGPKDIEGALSAKGVGKTNGAVREMLSQMVKDGQVKSLGRGAYVHPDYRNQADNADNLTNRGSNVRSSGMSGQPAFGTVTEIRSAWKVGEL